MTFGQIGARWKELSDNLKERVAVLIVDDEPLVGELLGSVAEDLGWRFESVDTAEAALGRARDGSYDLIIVDKNLPGHDGVDLIGQLTREGNDTPCVLITGYPTAETVSRSLAEGAVDYITKPFEEIGHLQKRLSSIVDQRRQARMVAQMVRDLSGLVDEGDSDVERVRALGMELFAQRHKLAGRPDVLILDVEPGLAEQTGRLLERAGVRVVYPTGEDVHASIAELSPMCTYLSLEVPGAVDLVTKLREAHPAMSVLVSGREQQLQDALAAVRAGANDFVLGAIEGLDVLVRRVRRAAASARKLKMQQKLVTLVHRVSLELDVDLTESVGAWVREDSGDNPPAPAEGEEVDISDLFDDDVAGGEASGAMAISLDSAGQALAKSGTTIAEQIEYGLDSVDDQRTAEVNVAALLRAYRTLVETLRFFSDAGKPSPEQTERFLGDLEGGALATWMRAYHELRDQLPDDIKDELDWGLRFAHPWPPYYLKE